MSGYDSQIRGEKAAEKARKVQKQLDLIEYVIEGTDVIFTTGQYAGTSVAELWPAGPLERDYIIKNLWFRNDDQVNEILNKLCCR